LIVDLNSILGFFFWLILTTFGWAILCKMSQIMACWRLIVISKFVYDLQADKSLVVVKGPFFPRVVNPRYRIRGTNVWRKSWSSKAK
jgi:hypothetical protein